MAAVGRMPDPNERDKPPIHDVITQSHPHADEDGHVENVITCSKPSGPLAPGSAMPQIANTITKTGPNK